jgi:hypothetical protein
MADKESASFVKDCRDKTLETEEIVQWNGGKDLMMNKRTHNICDQDMTHFLIPYKNNRVHDKHVSCSQKLGSEKFEESLSEVHRKMDNLTMQVSKLQSSLFLSIHENCPRCFQLTLIFFPILEGSNFEIFCTNFVSVFGLCKIIYIKKWETTYTSDTLSTLGHDKCNILIYLEWY